MNIKFSENIVFSEKISEEEKSVNYASKTKVERNFGLDIIRSFAIILVVISHIITAFNGSSLNLLIGEVIGTYGVELFFVLSGFLIGKILINLFSQKTYNLQHIKTFYKRRWFRTLPLYYLALLINIVLVKLFHPNINILSAFYLKYLIFVQNIKLDFLNFYGVSWSLSIEEWFYLSTPLLLAVFHKNKIKSENLYINIIKSIILIVFIRFLYVLFVNPSFVEIRACIIPLRFDSLLIGVLFACLKINNREVYDKFLNKRTQILNFIILILITFYYIYFLITNSYYEKTSLSIDTIFIKTLFMSFVSLIFAFLIIFFENNKFINQKLNKFVPVKFFFEKTSLYAYSIYLFHINIIMLYGFFFIHLDKSPLLLLSCIFTIYLVGFIVYKYYEKPIMNLRDKF